MPIFLIYLLKRDRTSLTWCNRHVFAHFPHFYYRRATGTWVFFSLKHPSLILRGAFWKGLAEYFYDDSSMVSRVVIEF